MAEIFVTLGTDCHPFDRLVRWIDEWLEAGPRGLRVLVQHGSTAAPRTADGIAYLGYLEMRGAIDEAAVVVSHGGPGTIMLALSAGKRPIVVPRMSKLGEHVDDHQPAFVRRLATEGAILPADTQQAFATLLDAAVENRNLVCVRERPLDSRAAVANFAEAVDALVAPRRAGKGCG